MSEAGASEAEQNAALKRRARLGMLALGARSVAQNVLVLGANVYLARALSPADYGVFAILEFAVAMLKTVAEAGLAPALIQQKSAPDQRILSTVWWLQLAVCAALVALLALAGPYLRLIWPSLPANAPLLVTGLALGLLFNVLRIVPLLLLERSIRFGLIGTLELVGSVVHYGTAIALATHGFGAGALVAASLAQSLALTLITFILQPWRPTLAFDGSRVKKLVAFGLTFQGSNVVGFINGAVTPLLVGARLGKEALGLVQFAQKTANFPTLPVSIVRRVSFPHLSRLQHDPPAFAREFENAVVLCAAPIFFFFGLFLGVGPSLIPVVYSDKWLPALPALYVYSAAISVNFFYWIGSGVLEALGAPGRLLRLTTIATLINWPATLIALSIQASPLSFALGFSVHMVAGTVGIYLALRELAPLAHPLSRVGAFVVAGLVLALVGRLALPWTHSVLGLIGWVVCALVLFAGVSLALDRRLRAALTGYLRPSLASK